ncbi:MAG: hypothetical protein M1833_005555 [Piccolia ochrophora]|nr:MAG: hypothetical protein M1833_005555 [Piccolia ochrophora]
MAARDNTSQSFNDVIQAGREKKKNQALAEEIFGKGRRASAPGGAFSGRKPPSGPSLASRMGVTKRSASSTPRPVTPKPVANINAQWNHDLHRLNNLQASRVSQLPTRTSSARVTRNNRLYAALQTDDVANGSSKDINIRGSSNGLSIRGSAGPTVVAASNFAPGTTATDIETTMEPIGGEIVSCRLTSTHPMVVAEIIFVEREGAENVIATFNNQRADGRLLHVHLQNSATSRPGPPTQPAAYAVRSPEPAVALDLLRDRADRERRRTNAEIQDGRYGFDSGMLSAEEDRPLYSDRMLSPERGIQRAVSSGQRETRRRARW